MSRTLFSVLAVVLGVFVLACAGGKKVDGEQRGRPDATIPTCWYTVCEEDAGEEPEDDGAVEDTGPPPTDTGTGTDSSTTQEVCADCMDQDGDGKDQACAGSVTSITYSAGKVVVTSNKDFTNVYINVQNVGQQLMGAVVGGSPGARTWTFTPQSPPPAGTYRTTFHGALSGGVMKVACADLTVN